MEGLGWKWRERYTVFMVWDKTNPPNQDCLNSPNSRMMWEIWKRFRISLQTGPMKKGETLKRMATLKPEEKDKG